MFFKATLLTLITASVASAADYRLLYNKPSCTSMDQFQAS